jgi:hypothetical protein
MIQTGNIISSLLNAGDCVIYNCDTSDKLEVCKNYSYENSYNIVEIVNSDKLEYIMKSYYFNLIIYSEKELNLNLKDFISLLEKCKDNNIIVHFVKDNLISYSNYDLRKMVTLVFDNNGIY